MKKIICVLLLCLLCLPVFAAKWMQVANKRWIDISSYKIEELSVQDGFYASTFHSTGFYKKKVFVTFWEKALNDGRMSDYDNKKIWYSLSKYSINCTDRTFAITSMSLYDLKENVIDMNEWSGSNLHYSSIVPDTYTESYANRFCKGY